MEDGTEAGGPDLLCGVLESELKCVECCKYLLTGDFTKSQF